MEIGFELKPLQKLEAKLRNFNGKIEPSLEMYDRYWMERLLQEVKRRASGRPGPNVVTGRYLSRFQIVGKKVVNSSPQAHRLEYGFIGTDSAGRAYHQPPFPHFRPALAVVQQQYRAGFRPMIVGVWRSS